MSVLLRVLMVEDSDDDVLLIARYLQRSGYKPIMQQVDTAQAMSIALAEQTWDIIIADYSMPRFDGLTALALFQQSGLDLPFILVSGTIGEDAAVAAMKAGAHDYVLKDNLARLGPAVQRELQEARERQARRQAEKSLHESEARFRKMADNIQDGLIIMEHGQVVYLNERACEIFGYPKGELSAMMFPSFAAPDEREDLVRMVREFRDTGIPNELEFWIVRKDGTRRCIQARYSPSRDGDEIVGHYVIATDITERKRAERLLQALNEAALAVEQAMTPEEIFLAVGEEFKKLGVSCAILLTDESRTRLVPTYYSYEGRAVRAAEKLLGVDASNFSIAIDSVARFQEVVHGGSTILVDGDRAVEQVLPKPLKRFARQLVRLLQVPKSIGAPLVVDDQVIGLLSVQSEDLTEDDIPAITAFANQVSAAWRKAKLLQDLEASLEELTRTQAQFLQAQKMEAVGRLAGGVAHDFNNTLTIIHLSTQLLKRQLHADDPLLEYVQQIEEAVERASNLTRQLLSFSRREIVEPRIVNLNQLVDNLSGMLQRIIGEDIVLVTSLADDLWPVYLDPSQIYQCIVNLAVNARDAMPQGGRLTIETANVVLDQTRASEHLDVEPGDYVRLAASDTGVGMSKKVQEHIFEPFFTTKEREHGTGLGLSTVFGIVKQSGGEISVWSQVGRGTTFTIYLPRTQQTDLRRPAPARPTGSSKGSETVLVVEDDLAIRSLAARTLQTCGYQVLTASSGPEALAVSDGHVGPIHLLLTDIVMPEMNGRDLSERLQAQRPEMRVLFMSGHSHDLIKHQGMTAEGAVFLAKPFTVDAMTAKVREALDAGR